MQCNETTNLTDSFVTLRALLFWLRIEVVDPRFIPNNKFWNKFLLGHIRIVREVLQKLVHSSGVSISTPIWQTLCSYAKMHRIFTAQKSHCACRVLSLATIRSKYYLNFILNRTRSARELFDHPSYVCVCVCLVRRYRASCRAWCSHTVRQLCACYSRPATLVHQLTWVMFTQRLIIVTQIISVQSHCVTATGGTAAAAPLPFRPSDPALCGSRPLVTPY